MNEIEINWTSRSLKLITSCKTGYGMTTLLGGEVK